LEERAKEAEKRAADLETQVQGYLAHKKTPTPLRTPLGPQAYSGP
jgi:hypothetical protein